MHQCFKITISYYTMSGNSGFCLHWDSLNYDHCDNEIVQDNQNENGYVKVKKQIQEKLKQKTLLEKIKTSKNHFLPSQVTCFGR